MGKFLKAAAASATAALLAVSVPQAGALTNFYPTSPDFFGKDVYHFDDGKPALSVVVPEGEQFSGNARIMADNQSDGMLHCTYWFGPESAIRPAYDVVLHGDPADAVEHSTQINEAIQNSGRVADARKFYVTHYSPGEKWAETVDRGVDLQGEPFAVLTDCREGIFTNEKSFNYTVVDEEGNELPNLIPDAAAIRAGLDSSESQLSSGSSSLFGSSF